MTKINTWNERKKKECFNKNKKIPVKPLVIEVNRYKDTFRLYYIFTNNKEIKNEKKKI